MNGWSLTWFQSAGSAGRRVILPVHSKRSFGLAPAGDGDFHRDLDIGRTAFRRLFKGSNFLFALVLISMITLYPGESRRRLDV